MRHEKIIKHKDGTQYLITVDLLIDIYGEVDVEYRFGCRTRKAGKRNWMELPDEMGDYKFRSLSLDDRRKHTIDNILKFVSKQEILEAKLELWNKIKPE